MLLQCRCWNAFECIRHGIIGSRHLLMPAHMLWKQDNDDLFSEKSKYFLFDWFTLPISKQQFICTWQMISFQDDRRWQWPSQQQLPSWIFSSLVGWRIRMLLPPSSHENGLLLFCGFASNSDDDDVCVCTSQILLYNGHGKLQQQQQRYALDCP